MKLRTIIAAFAATVAVAAPAAAEEQVYYCSSELGTGITKDEQTGQWRTGTFKNIRFTVKLGETLEVPGNIFGHHRLILGRDGWQEDYLCSSSQGFHDCTRMTRPSIEKFFGNEPSPPIVFSYNKLITDLKRFELYLTSHASFVEWGGEDGDNSAMYAGTCETF